MYNLDILQKTRQSVAVQRDGASRLVAKNTHHNILGMHFELSLLKREITQKKITTSETI